MMWAFWTGAFAGFWGAVILNHWINLLYDPPLPTVADEADEYVRAQPHWRRTGP